MASSVTKAARLWLQPGRSVPVKVIASGVSGFALGRIGPDTISREDQSHLSPSQHHEEAEIMFTLCTWIFWFIVGVAYTAIRARVK